MQFITYLKERIYQMIWLAIWLFTVDMFLLTYYGSLPLGVYINVTAIFSYFLINYMEFYRTKTYFDELTDLNDSLDKKYLLPELMKKGKRQEERQFYDLVKDMGKSMTEHVNEFKYSNREYKEYIEMWIHEVKIPIATASLVLANHKNEISSSIEEELNKIEGYIEQALFYARSNYVEKDYRITDVSLKDVVHQVLLKNKRNLIEKRAKMNLHGLDTFVLSDSKWLGFIINQLISNAIKYAKEELSIEIYAEEQDGICSLHVKDNGVGIRQEDLPFVFEKGFTGNNGRKKEKSTGIGLYLCEKLCGRLGHKIVLQSEEDNGCEVIVYFTKTDFYDTVS